MEPQPLTELLEDYKGNQRQVEYLALQISGLESMIALCYDRKKVSEELFLAHYDLVLELERRYNALLRQQGRLMGIR